MTLYEELKWRNLIYQETDESLRDKLNNDQLTFYIGTDPTADSLHVGHLMANLVAKRLENHGHHPILVIGGGTGLIGDPSFKAEERQLLSIEESLKNAEGITKQVKSLLPTATVVNNYEWLSSLNAIEFLRDIGKHFSINYMMAKDSVKSRIERGISFTEFSYQVIQAWDFEYLYKHHHCTLQIGGQDQWGNITSGSELIRRVHGADAKVYGLTFPLVTKSDGTKFGKTESGAIWLDPKRTSPYEFYQFWINTSDADVMMRLKQFTFLSKEEIDKIELSLEKEPEKRLAQQTLANQVTEMVHGKNALKQAVNISKALFSGEIKDLTVEEIEMGFKGLPSLETKENISLIDALKSLNLVQSNRQAREMIQNNAVSVNGEKKTDTYFECTKDDAIGKIYTVLRKGKKKYGVIKHI